MDWQPINEDEFEAFLQKQIDKLPAKLLSVYKSISFPARRVICKRINSSQKDSLIAIGKYGNKILLYDDVEDEFGLAFVELSDVLPIEDWALCGPLEFALKQLN